MYDTLCKNPLASPSRMLANKHVLYLCYVCICAVPFCDDELPSWWNEGCVHDYSDTECELDIQNLDVDSAYYNPVAGCGWGGYASEGRLHHYDCGENDQRTCRSFCY